MRDRTGGLSGVEAKEDEPTKHLDVEAIDWLEGMIRRQREMAVLFRSGSHGKAARRDKMLKIRSLPLVYDTVGDDDCQKPQDLPSSFYER